MQVFQAISKITEIKALSLSLLTTQYSPSFQSPISLWTLQFCKTCLQIPSQSNHMQKVDDPWSPDRDDKISSNFTQIKAKEETN